MEKHFFNKKKIITYNADIWFKAEKHFDTIQKAKTNNTDVKIQVEGDMFISSNVWGENQRWYTGIHGFDALGRVKPLTGVNLDEDEWVMLTHNFNSVKDFFNGKKDALKNVFIPPKDMTDMVKMYKGNWYIGDKLIPVHPSPHEFFNHEEAAKDAFFRKPKVDIDYSEEDGVPEMRIDCEIHQPPENTHLMNLVLVEHMDQNIQAEAKEHCEACQLDSPSQFDHCKCGNCLDDTFGHGEMYGEPARKKIKVGNLMNVFDQVHSEIGVKPVLSMQLAKCALEWIPNEKICNQIEDMNLCIFPLMQVVQKVHLNVTEK